MHGEFKNSLGLIMLPCKYKGQVYNLEFEILDGIRNLNLLGRCDAVRMGLIARVNVVDTKVYVEDVNASDRSRKQMLHEYRDVIGESIGCMPGEYVIKIDHTVL